MNMRNSKTNEPRKIVLNFSERLDIRNSDKHVALQNLSVTRGKIFENSIRTAN